MMFKRSKAVAFDLDAASLISLRQGLPNWEIEVVNGATADSLSRDWNPGAADLLVVMACNDMAKTLGMCRFLAFCSSCSTDARDAVARASKLPGSGVDRIQRADAPLLVLVPSERESLMRAALQAGAHSCLVLPINAKDVASMLVHAQTDNQPGRNTTNLERAQDEDRWRDDGGQG